MSILSDVKGPNMDLFREILSQAKSHVGAWGGTLYFVYLPELGALRQRTRNWR